MLDRISKIITIIASTVAIVVILIGGIAWAVRLDSEVRGVQHEVGELRQEVTELRRDMDEVKANQILILRSLERLETAVSRHTHDEDGRVQVPLSR